MAQYTFGGVVDRDFEDVHEELVKALGREGFGVLTEIDVAATLKEKLDQDMPPYRILGACSPPLAFEAISQDPRVGALLPCNVVVRKTADGVGVDFMDPHAVLGLLGEDMGALAAEVRSRLDRVKDAVLG